MKDQNSNSSNDEIELGFLFKTMEGIIRKIAKQIFLVLAFFRKYAIIVGILIIAGIGIGYFLDTNSQKIPVYENHVIVIPNFESVDYLYETVEELKAKLANNDTIYLQSVLGENYKYLTGVDIEPIVDIYNFASKSQENLQVFNILFKNQELSEFVEDMVTSKYFKYHKMNFSIVGKDNSEIIIQKILDYFNSNEHYKAYQALLKDNTARLIEENTRMIDQVDSLIQTAISYGKQSAGSQNVLINDNSDLGTLIFRKQAILSDRAALLKESIDEESIVKKVSANYNIINKRFFSFSNKVKLPVLFVLFFSLLFFIRYTYRGLKSLAEVE